MGLADEHSDLNPRPQQTFESRHFENLSDVGSFQPLQSVAMVKQTYTKKTDSRYLSSFVSLLSSERNHPASPGVWPIIHPPAPDLPLGNLDFQHFQHESFRIVEVKSAAPVYSAKAIWSLEAVNTVTVFDCLTAIGLGKPREEEIPLQVSEDAQKRLRSHEGLFHKLVFIIRQEAAARRVPLRKIEALGAWSHEYEDNNGIVIHVEVQGSDDERFALWEGISERINLLHDALFAEEREFLTREISVIVDRQ